MKRRKKQNSKTLVLLLCLVFVGISIAYAVLTEQLTINNTVSYDAMKWDVGFSKTEDNSGTITSTSSITNDGKSITVNCDFGKNTTQQSCIVKATITNNGTFDIGLSSDPIITYDDTYIHTLTFKWEDHPTYLNSTVLERGFVEKGTSQNVILTVKTKNLTKDMLPSDGVSVPITITLDFEEWWEDELPTTDDLAILAESGCNFDDNTGQMICVEGSFGELLSTLRPVIKSITFENEITSDCDSLSCLDISASSNGSVMAYSVANDLDSNYYDIFIQSDTQLYANQNMSTWFAELINLEKINGIELLDTSMTTDMSFMFNNISFFSSGSNVEYHLSELDLSSFDTSNVTDMSGMFVCTGLLSPTFTLDVSKFDTSKVSKMGAMFIYTGGLSEALYVDVSNFDTSNVVDMEAMFYYFGVSSTDLVLNVSNFNTAQVTNMDSMFSYAGASSLNFSLDVSNFDTSVVDDMSYMFESAGRDSKNFTTTITIRNPNVESYKGMFNNVATENGSQIRVNYTSETSDLVDQMIATKSDDSNVVKGVQVD